MLWTRPPLRVGVSILYLCGAVVAAAVMMSSVAMRSAQNPAPPKSTAGLSSPPALNNQPAATTPKENSESKKSDIEETKTDAAELSALADQLRDELKKMNVNVLPLDVLEKTQKLEKLARKIKGEAYDIRD
jgi:hypothetical protein